MSFPARRLVRPLLLIAALVAPTASAAAERLSLPDLDGANHTLAEWKGRAVLLNFWASWCAPCIAEVPYLRALGERYRERGLSIVSIGIDEPLKLRNVARTLAIDYPVLVADPDNARPLLDAWGNRRGVIPYLVLIDSDGHVTATHRGPIDKDSLDELVRPALAAEASRQ